MSVYVIAEAGVNHNGSIDRALAMIDCAAAAGANAVKFQTFRAADLVSRHAPKAEYQERATGREQSQLEMVRELELDESAHRRLVDHCQARGIQFLSTPFDPSSVALLQSLGVPLIKVPSGEITNPLLLRAVAATGLPLIVSTGMSTLDEIERALAILDARERVTLLHCTTEYPAPLGEVNLRAMTTMAARFGLPVGYSDHTPGITVPIAAVALGATVIEKHFTLDRALPGPDHAASLEPDELTAMVAAIRATEQALGSAVKGPTAAEMKNLAVARRSLVAARAIRRGEPFTAENLTTKRPGSGVPAMEYDAWLGRLADRDYEPDELIGV